MLTRESIIRMNKLSQSKHPNNMVQKLAYRQGWEAALSQDPVVLGTLEALKRSVTIIGGILDAAEKEEGKPPPIVVQNDFIVLVQMLRKALGENEKSELLL